MPAAIARRRRQNVTRSSLAADVHRETSNVHCDLLGGRPRTSTGSAFHLKVCRVGRARMETTQSLRMHRRTTLLLAKCSLHKQAGNRHQYFSSNHLHSRSTARHRDNHSRRLHRSRDNRRYHIQSSQLPSQHQKRSTFSCHSRTPLHLFSTSHRQTQCRNPKHFSRRCRRPETWSTDS